MTALLQQGFLSVRYPSRCCNRAAPRRHLPPPLFRFQAPNSGYRCHILSETQRISRFVPLASSSEDSRPLNIETEKDKHAHNSKTNDIEEAWLKALESFRDESAKMKSISQEAYELYSKKAAIILNETSEKLQYHADNARDDFSLIAEEISEGSKQFVSSTPEVKETLEVIASFGEPNGISSVRDFHVGLIYGLSLVVGGLLSFMITGDTVGIRFGVVVGSILTYSSLLSYRSWKSKGSSSNLYTQAVMAGIIFSRELWLLFLSHSYFAFLRTLLSAAAVAFMIHRIVVDNPGPVKQEQHIRFPGHPVDAKPEAESRGPNPDSDEVGGFHPSS